MRGGAVRIPWAGIALALALPAASISAEHDLSAAMEHVRGHLYATSSPHDGILAGLRINADGQSGHPAGLRGLRIPSRVKRYDLYTRVRQQHPGLPVLMMTAFHYDKDHIIKRSRLEGLEGVIFKKPVDPDRLREVVWLAWSSPSSTASASARFTILPVEAAF